MKCDELQERWFEAYPVEGDQIIATKVYSKKDADAAIAELKADNERLTIDKRNAELRADVADQTIEKLKANRQNLEDHVAYFQKKASDFQLMSDIRRVKIKELARALWIVRAERAHVTTLLWNIYCYQNNCLYFRDFMNIKCNPFRSLPKKTAMEWSDLWESIETKCRDKAKEYK